MSETSTPAGWYPDSSDPSIQRYWDGSVWTDHTVPTEGQQGSAVAYGIANTATPASGGPFAANVQRRADSNLELGSYGTFVLLMIVTCGIYGIIMMHKWYKRTHLTAVRKRDFYYAAIDATAQKAQEQGRYAEVEPHLLAIRQRIDAAYANTLTPMEPGIAILLTIFTGGIGLYYAIYKMEQYWWNAQLVEQEFVQQMNGVLPALGLLSEPIAFQADPSTERSFGTCVVLALVTCGLYSLFSWYARIHNDPNMLYPRFNAVEDQIARALS